MENYENIMKLVDKQLGEQESVIEYYRDKQKEWQEHNNNLVQTNLSLKAKIDGFEAEKNEILQVIQAEEAENKQLREENEQLKNKIKELEGDCDNA